MIQLRDYQQCLLDKIGAQFRAGHRSVLAQMPTGSGKTAVAITAAYLAASRGKRVLFQAHTRPLVDQTVEKFTSAGVEVGILMAGRIGNNLPIQVGSVQTISRRTERIRPFDLIITDECRRSTSAVYRTILSAWPAAYHIGLDATPCRTDGRGLGDIYETMVCGPSVRELIDAGHLAPFSVFAPNPVDASGLRMRGGEFDQDEVADLMDRAVITGDCVDHYMRLAGDRQALTYCASIRHAGHVYEAFVQAGVPSAILHSDLSPTEQSSAIAGIRSGQVRNLISVGMVNDGFDVPNVSCAILLRPTASLSLAWQQWGRANRGGSGPTALILDHAGNVLRHGLPDTEIEWTLEGREKRKKHLDGKKIAIKHCRICFSVYLSGLPKCPHCGASPETQARSIEQRDGELIEITPEMKRKAALETLSYDAALRMCETPSQIREMANARKYKATWAVLRVMERWGVDRFKAAQMLGYGPGIALHVKGRKAA